MAMSVGAARFLSALNVALQHSREDRANSQNNAREVAWEGSGEAVAIGAFPLRKAIEGIHACVGTDSLEYFHDPGSSSI